MLQLGVTLKGDLRKEMAAEVMATEKAVTSAIRRASNGLKDEIRNQIKAAGLGQRFANTIRATVYPKKQDSLNAAGFIYAAAKSSKNRFYTNVFEEGEIIRAQGNRWLALPINVGYFGNKRVGIDELKRLNLEFRPTSKPGVALLVQRMQGRPDAPLFILLKQVRIRKRIDALGASEKWAAQVPELIAEEMAKGSK